MESTITKIAADCIATMSQNMTKAKVLIHIVIYLLHRRHLNQTQMTIMQNGED